MPTYVADDLSILPFSNEVKAGPYSSPEREKVRDSLSKLGVWDRSFSSASELGCSDASIAKAIGVTRQRIRQVLEQEAMRKELTDEKYEKLIMAFPQLGLRHRNTRSGQRIKFTKRLCLGPVTGTIQRVRSRLCSYRSGSQPIERAGLRLVRLRSGRVLDSL